MKSTDTRPHLTAQTLPDIQPGEQIWHGKLPSQIHDQLTFETLWELHPEARPEIRLFGKLRPIPRWQKAYGRDYHFSGQTSTAAPVPAVLDDLVAWIQAEIDPRLNGLLLNWYDGEQQHYIGAHHDSETGLVPGAPIVTVSLGAPRTFRFSRPKDGGGGRIRRDFEIADGSVIAFSWEVNQRWKHEVPHFASNSGRRISVTFRAFEGADTETVDGLARGDRQDSGASKFESGRGW